VCAFLIEMLALATLLPEESVIAPESVAATVWACEGFGNRSKRKSNLHARTSIADFNFTESSP
jgi:hypothetical protein